MIPTQPSWQLWVRRIISQNKKLQGLFAGTRLHAPAIAIITVSCVWLLMVLLVNPSGEFPLNDDWSYSRVVQSLVEHGRLELTGFTSMTLIAQVLWGSLFCLPFGFSFTALRISTITLGLTGILATYWLFKELKVNLLIALLSTMVVAANPLYFSLSLTFMTDVPFFTFSMLSFLFLLRALRDECNSDLIIGYAFSFVAIFIRQLAIIIPLSFLVAYFVKNRINLQAIRKAFLPGTSFAALLLIYPVVMRRTIGLPVLYDRPYEPIIEAASLRSPQFIFVFADRLFIELMYLGLLILPFSIVLAMNTHHESSSRMRRLSAFAGFTLTSVVLGLFLWQGRIMPLSGNVLFNFGLGPALLTDTYLLKLPHWPTAPNEIWFFITTAAFIGSILLIRLLLPSITRLIHLYHSRSKDELAITLFFLSAVVFYTGMIGITGFLDRYLFWSLPLLMGIISVPRTSIHLRIPVLPLTISLVLIFLYALFSIAGTHDYLAWNRARWQSLSDLMEKDGLSYKNIDGGFEFNGWFAYDPEYRVKPPKRVWWVEGDDYMVSFGPVPGYAIIRQYPFQRWIPFEQGHIMVLQRIGTNLPIDRQR